MNALPIPSLPTMGCLFLLGLGVSCQTARDTPAPAVTRVPPVVVLPPQPTGGSSVLWVRRLYFQSQPISRIRFLIWPTTDCLSKVLNWVGSCFLIPNSHATAPLVAERAISRKRPLPTRGRRCRTGLVGKRATETRHHCKIWPGFVRFFGMEPLPTSIRFQ